MENDGGVNAYALLATGGPLPTVMIASAFALLPIGVLMVTSFVKISIVLNVIRSAIAAPGVPSAAMTGLLSLVLTGQVMAPIAREAIPVVNAFGRTVLNTGQSTEGPTHHLNADITVMMNDPAEQKKAQAAE